MHVTPSDVGTPSIASLRRDVRRIIHDLYDEDKGLKAQVADIRSGQRRAERKLNAVLWASIGGLFVMVGAAIDMVLAVARLHA